MISVSITKKLTGELSRTLGINNGSGSVPPPANDNGAWLFNEPAQSSHMLTAGVL